MKKALLLAGIGIIILSLGAQSSYSWPLGKKSEKPVSAAETSAAKTQEESAQLQEPQADKTEANAADQQEVREAVSAPVDPKIAARREAENKAKETLSAKEWAVQITQLVATGKKPKTESDLLTFSPDGKVTSKVYSAKGYPTTNFTATAQENGSMVWETMQTNPESGVIFWHGELANGVMSGALSLQPKKGDNEDYYFVTAAQAAPAPVKVEPKETAPKETKGKKKK